MTVATGLIDALSHQRFLLGIIGDPALMSSGAVDEFLIFIGQVIEFAVQAFGVIFHCSAVTGFALGSVHMHGEVIHMGFIAVSGRLNTTMAVYAAKTAVG